MTQHRPARLALPVVAIAVLLWVMVGCVYIPWFEQANLYGAKRDFRELPRTSTAGPIVDGQISKAEVLRLFGKPASESPNGQVIAYLVTAQHGIWVEPFCFHLTPGGQYEYGLGLRFDGAGRLEHHYLVCRNYSVTLSDFEHCVEPQIQEQFARLAVLDRIDADNLVPQVSPYPWVHHLSGYGRSREFAVARFDGRMSLPQR